MATLKPLLKVLLKQKGLTLEQINKKQYKKQKSEILADMMTIAITESKNKKSVRRLGNSIEQVRATGLKFSNQEAREVFYTRTKTKVSAKNATKLRGDYVPNLDRIPDLTGVADEKGGFLYTARVYLAKANDNPKRIP